MRDHLQHIQWIQTILVMEKNAMNFPVTSQPATKANAPSYSIWGWKPSGHGPVMGHPFQIATCRDQYILL